MCTKDPAYEDSIFYIYILGCIRIFCGFWDPLKGMELYLYYKLQP